ncbi:MAG: CoA transferase [Hyphomicrobiaceae bacterium]|nr:CoA transferase [Hyphomicrobiaceae bacterium]
MAEHEQDKPLSGVRVIDLTRYLSGPQATLFLAGLGAEVIKIDDPSTGDPTAGSPPFYGAEGVSMSRRTPGDLGIAYLKRARGKRSITLNIKSPQGREILYRLLETADVLVENFRVGVSAKLGLDRATVAARFPRLIHCAITGYGQSGPECEAKAYDLMVQAAAGLMSITGEPNGAPCKTGSSLTDGIAGSFALSGIAAALFQRERTGRGQFIDVPMVDCLLSLMLDEPLDRYDELGLSLRQGNRIMRFSPFNSYPTLDDGLVLGAATRADWEALLDIMGRSDLLDSPTYGDPAWRIQNNEVIDQLVGAWTSTLTTRDALERLSARDIACAPIRDARTLGDWQHLKARGFLTALQHPTVTGSSGPLAPGFPLKFSGATTGYDAPASLVGKHTEAVLGSELGIAAEELVALRRDGII